MIKIDIKKQNILFQNITIYGHSNYDEYGKDIICAAISGIVQGMFNAIDKICSNKDVDLILDPKNIIQASIKVKNINNNKLQILLTAFYYQLETIRLQFPKYIKINEVL